MEKHVIKTLKDVHSVFAFKVSRFKESDWDDVHWKTSAQPESQRKIRCRTVDEEMEPEVRAAMLYSDGEGHPEGIYYPATCIAGTLKCEKSGVLLCHAPMCSGNEAGIALGPVGDVCVPTSREVFRKRSSCVQGL